MLFQIPLAISYAFFFVLPMSSLITGESLVELFGDNICMPFFMAQTFHNIWMTVSGFGISLFRFTCMWDNLLIFEKDKLKTLMKGIFVGEIIMTLFQMSLSKYFKNPEWWADICINKWFVFFSHFWNLFISKSIRFGFLSWIWPRIQFNSSGIQWIRHRNSNSWKNHDGNKQHGDLHLHSRNYCFVWIHILAFAENQ